MNQMYTIIIRNLSRSLSILVISPLSQSFIDKKSFVPVNYNVNRMSGVVRKIIKTVKAPAAIGPYRLIIFLYFSQCLST